MIVKPVAHGTILQRNKVLLGCIVCTIAVTYLSLSRCSSPPDSIEALSLLNINRDNNIRLEGKEDDSTLATNKKQFPGTDYPDPSFQMNAIPAPEYHLVVSTGCNTYQDWQSYVLFYHAVKSGQVNGKSLSYVTRVVSGCDEAQAEMMNEIHADTIEPIAPGKFFIHHTPEYSRAKPTLVYKFFNKPMGYRHWMINALRYPYNHKKYDNTTFILMDPDQVILRPFTNDFTNETERWGGPFRDKRIVEIGQPFAQEYAFGVQKWTTQISMRQVVPINELPSHVQKMTRKDAFAYMVGPPYILKGADMWKIISKWAEIVPHVHEQLPEHLAEMYAYSIAAAHLKLPHQVAHTFMISNAELQKGEGWQPIDESNLDEDVCRDFPERDMPHTIHYCQEYGVGKHFFSKYELPQNFIGCESPLMIEPPPKFYEGQNYMITPGKNIRKDFKSLRLTRRMAFSVCHIIKAVNEAAIYFKRHNCDSKANFNKTFNFFETDVELMS